MASLKRTAMCDSTDEGEVEGEDEVALLLSRVAAQDVGGVVALLAGGTPAALQDDASGVSALMVAAGAGCLPLVTLLLEGGAPWNALDRRGRCAGEYAVEGGHQAAVDLLVSAGVAAELLFGAMDRSKKRLEAAQGAAAAARAAAAEAAEAASSSSSTASAAVPYDAHFPAPEGLYLEDRGVRYDGADRLLDSADDAVMMAWETPLMEAHADVLMALNLDQFGTQESLGVDLATSVQAYEAAAGAAAAAAGALAEVPAAPPAGRAVLNVGFGMGIVDGALQRRSPGRHVIVEAHPVVHAKMIADGWGDRPGVVVVFGKWQDVDLASYGPFDGVFFDTYGERYSDMEDFHSALPSLLKPGGVYSLFNGMCPFNIFFHGVACELVKTELASLGLRTAFVPLRIDLDPAEWEGVTRKYWQRDVYYLPIAVYLP